jgi:HSP20 family molecular chaperone IbpA
MSEDAVTRADNGELNADGSAPVERRVFTPPIDIFETDEGLVLRADLPGVTAETLDLQVQDNKLTLFGRAEARLPDSDALRHQEFESGDFLRSFILSDEVDHERIQANLSNGVLVVVLPKLAQSEPRRIQVNID